MTASQFSSQTSKSFDFLSFGDGSSNPKAAASSLVLSSTGVSPEAQ
jgi:hypothetical protein